MIAQRTYKTFPFNPSKKMYHDIIAKIQSTRTVVINDTFGLGTVEDDPRPKLVLIESLRLMIEPQAEPSPDVFRCKKSFVKAIGDILEESAPIDLAALINETDVQSGNLVKSMLLHAIENLERAMSGKSKVQQL